MSKIDKLKEKMQKVKDISLLPLSYYDIQTLLTHIDSLEKTIKLSSEINRKLDNHNDDYKAENEKLKAMVTEYIDLAAKHSRDLSIAEQKLAKASNTLKKYGDENSYPMGKITIHEDLCERFVLDDRGELARTTPAEIGESDE